MAYTAKDGKQFTHPMQGQVHDRWLRDSEKAPGGPTHKDALLQHGPVKKIVIEREGMGRHRVTATHQDGETHTSVHPEAYRAHEITRELLGIEPPPAIQTHSRARAQPQGPKEEDRIRKEDHREEDDAPQ